ncbi:ribbon-helix-helix protein, CopG family [Candidatus Poriferisodalis sp.]|uniref:ribbon-helix-helix protein, CopG family n=1 Tax=Candidatus Poriferisodalis sp. TaxID=3101277 RepID=UPI003B011937
MARREVRVQLDNELIERLAEIADAEGTSTSELLRRGARAVIEAADVMAADTELIAAYRREPQDEAFVEAATQLAVRTAISW